MVKGISNENTGFGKCGRMWKEKRNWPSVTEGYGTEKRRVKMECKWSIKLPVRNVEGTSKKACCLREGEIQFAMQAGRCEWEVKQRGRERDCGGWRFGKEERGRMYTFFCYSRNKEGDIDLFHFLFISLTLGIFKLFREPEAAGE